MADLQDEIKKLEEERAKRIADERRQQNIDAEKIKDAKADLLEKQLKAEEKLQSDLEQNNKKIKITQERIDKARANRDQIAIDALERQLASEQHNQTEKEKRIKEAHDVTINSVKEEISVRDEITKQVIAQQKAHALTEKQKADELHKKELEAQESSAQKLKELGDKEEKLTQIKDQQIKGIKGALLGANKVVLGFTEGIKERFSNTALGKVTGFGMNLLGIGKEEDPLKKQQEAIAIEKKIRTEEPTLSDEDIQKKVAEEQKEPEKVSLSLKMLGLGGIVGETLKQQSIAGDLLENVDTTQPQRVEVVSTPPVATDIFAEEQANESAGIQAEQAETQERMADALGTIVSNEEEQTINIKGQDTGTLEKIASGKFNPLKSLQGIVKGIFKVIQEFIKGIGNIIKEALKVVEKLVDGIGKILSKVIDIVGKGFVNLMTFAGQGIAALFQALGKIDPITLAIGAAALGVITLAFMGLGKALQLMAPALKIVVDGFVALVKTVGGILLNSFKALISGIKELSKIPFANFLSLAGGLAALVIPLAAFGVAATIATPGLLGLSLGVTSLGLALGLLAPAIETAVPPITTMLGAFGNFLDRLQGIVSNFFTSIGNFITTVGTALSSFITTFAQALVSLGDANFLKLAIGFALLGPALGTFALFATSAIPAMVALGIASKGLAELVAIPEDRFASLANSFKLLGYAVKNFSKDAKGLGGIVASMIALSFIPMARKLLDLQIAKTETRNVINTVKGGVADAIQPVDIVSFSGARTDRGVSMIEQAVETAEIRDETTMATATPTNNVITSTSASSVTNNAVIVQDSPTDAGFRASASTY